jgi:alpha-D-ribose 1-methylphosphonate 5-triphosphate synthase subunit PhnL
MHAQALIGPSGAGKSTLMNILAMRKSVGSLSGQLLVNHQPADASYLHSTSYVAQVRQPLLGYVLSHCIKKLCSKPQHVPCVPHTRLVFQVTSGWLARIMGGAFR